MHHLRVPTLAAFCGLFVLLLLSLRVTSTALLQTSESAPGEPSTAEPLLIRPLKRIFETKPSYTEQARVSGIEGSAVIYAEITENGSAKNLRLLRSLGYGLDEEALKAVQQWRFEPYVENGRLCRAATYVPVTFRLDRQIYGANIPSKTANEIFQVGVGGITAPRILSRVEPTFTQEARVAKIQGTLFLFIIVTSAGTVDNAVVLQGLGKGMDENALEAIKQWKFVPALKDGQPIPVMLTVEIQFALG